MTPCAASAMLLTQAIRFHSGSNCRVAHLRQSITGHDTHSSATINHSKAATCNIAAKPSGNAQREGRSALRCKR